MTTLEIRQASAAEFEVAIGWAADEGWNPGLDDLAVFHAADREGFLIGCRDGVPVSSISVVRYGSGYGFLGFYIVHPEHRGQGHGIATWDAGMARLEGRVVGLDGVVAQQDNYRRSGFALAGRNIRYTGVPSDTAGDRPGAEVRDLSAGDLTGVLSYDRAFFPAPRDAFTEPWASPEAGTRRRAKIAVSDGSVTGYGVIRACRTGHKIGPLFADREATAIALFEALCGTAPGAEVSLDTPEGNPAARRLAERHGLRPVFETARMYRGPAPDLPLDRTFGITTFELG